MIVEIVSTGTELLLGQIVNTNAPYLARKLNEIGYDALYQTTVGDNRRRMSSVLSIAMERADLVITSGGLGPTQGDITKEVTAELLGRPMVLHEESAMYIECYFARRNLSMPQNNLRQAMMPEGAIVVRNHRGTAPGVILEHADKTIIHLPGPPMELEYMFETGILPYLTERFGNKGQIVSKVLRTFGLGESALEERIHDYILAQQNPTLALLARSGEIHVRLTAKGETTEQAHRLIAELEPKIRERIDEFVFGTDDQTLEQVVGAALTGKGFTIALAESCTGGGVSSRLTDMPGSSAYLKGSVVCYSNEIKIDVVGVPAATIAARGAVSTETAIAMAEGIRRRFGTTIGVGITGIAGPGGGTDEKPVGLVYIAVAGPNGTVVEEERFSGQRSGIRTRAANAALNLIRFYLKN
ncbi:MAG: competence/damage-inducible protein A [Veillonellaceae bacterium]|nr:competence/damage-inducible protein A [Veillonellaceae bacterium]